MQIGGLRRASTSLGKAEILDRGGKRREGELINVSETGAQIRCSPELGIGETGSLKLDGITAAIPFVVRGKKGDSLHVEFQITGTSSENYKEWLRTRVPRSSPRPFNWRRTSALWVEPVDNPMV